MPRPPFSIAVAALQGFPTHVAAVNKPPKQLDTPDTVYPEVHVGWHVDPLATAAVHVPRPPFVGAVNALQGFPTHVADVNKPPKQLDAPDTVYPTLHVG